MYLDNSRSFLIVMFMGEGALLGAQRYFLGLQQLSHSETLIVHKTTHLGDGGSFFVRSISESRRCVSRSRTAVALQSLESNQNHDRITVST